MAWSLPRRDPGEVSWRSLGAALKRLGARWIVLSDVCIEAPADRLFLEHVLVHPSCGVVLMDGAVGAAAADGGAAVVARFRAFLDDGEFEAFYPGFLPIVRLQGEIDAPADLPVLLTDAFANAPLLTIRDESWAAALATVITAAGRRDRSARAPAATPAKSATTKEGRPRPAVAAQDKPAAARVDAAFRLIADPVARPMRIEPHAGRGLWVIGLVSVAVIVAANVLLWNQRMIGQADAPAPAARVVADAADTAPQNLPPEPPQRSLVPADPSSANIVAELQPESRTTPTASTPHTGIVNPKPVPPSQPATASRPDWPPIPEEKPVTASQIATGPSAGMPHPDTSRSEPPRKPDRISRSKIARAQNLTPEGGGPPIDASDLPPLGPVIGASDR